MNLIEQDIDNNGILTLTLNRPEKLNALSTDVLNALNELFFQAKSNPKVKALLLTGNGKAFCAGADISRLAECNAQTGYEFACQGQEVFRLLETMGKPSLAAVNGFAFGGGCELAISATLRIASNKAMFGQPEVKLGVIPGYGGTQRLARLIGKGRAMDLCLTGRFINADTALNWGLVSEVVAPEDLLTQGKNILNGILSMAPLAVASVMEVIDHGYDLSLTEALHLEAIHFAKVCATEDKKEGVAAFLDKRTADFKGV
ncbi:TPA: enoyl-CoA hydratase-related protein [Legionella pneumophila]|uniref:enoyl-CoA hydratase/isomerase family protein n=1 Tax=Legionella pneumophila TaxID=446 RepID=UPI000770A003|nr:enoyl-CoA hydratase-related protein [Legionella pneumophila]HCC3245176.1 enoyl-CoA hydratase/isomerase family protein [Legionella pneumophila subsp. pneumophila]MCK1850579.1 enoyl-CoA hydratase-related protein [Legionella pneumophila]MCZ4805389.1 enoyl-CoA hydratase-related protein [Legionella pneumophila]MDI9851469.1 enoyl-CoA hydratase-related protein [Legionella pneumophila]MDW8853126.1 enoyl-CoA hydratase-related protein [Legionella pneumophila]